jgi:hypothetical protein
VTFADSRIRSRAVTSFDLDDNAISNVVHEVLKAFQKVSWWTYL